MSRRPVRRCAPALAVEQLEELDPPPVIPDGALLWASLGPLPDAPRPRSWFVVGLYDVDPMRELCRPWCTCGWTTESVLRWEDYSDAVRAMAVHAELDHGAGPTATLLRRY